MYCTNCGKEIVNDSKFCEHCGKKVDDLDIVSTTIFENTEKKNPEKVSSPDYIIDTPTKTPINNPETKGKSTKMIDNTKMFKRPFSFRGRIRRLEYGISIIIFWIFSEFIPHLYKVVCIYYYNSEESAVALIFLICELIIFCVFIVLFWFSLAQGAKRCHDLGHSG